MGKLSAFLLSFIILLPSAFADDAKNLLGVWKLLAFYTEYQDGRPQLAQAGNNPIGYLIFTAEGRMMAVIEAEGRKPASTVEERANLLRTLIAYSGMYRLESDKWTTKVDVAWSPLMRGTDQVRTYKLDGDRLEVTTPWAPTPGVPTNPVERGVLRWERVK